MKFNWLSVKFWTKISEDKIMLIISISNNVEKLRK
jgi:hypothetical protein